MGMAKIQSTVQGDNPYIYNCIDGRGRTLLIQATTFDRFEEGKWYYVADIDNKKNENNQRLIFDTLIDNIEGEFNVYPRNVWRTVEDLNPPRDSLQESEGNIGFKSIATLSILLQELFQKTAPGFRVDTVLGKTDTHLVLAKYGWASTVCTPEVFQTGDKVVVMFWKQEWGSPHVVGWHQKPRRCDCDRPMIELVPNWIEITQKNVIPYPGWRTAEKVAPVGTTEEIGLIPLTLDPAVHGTTVTNMLEIVNTAPIHADQVVHETGDVTYFDITVQFEIFECGQLRNITKIARRGPEDLQRADRSDETVIWEKGISATETPPLKFTVSSVVPPSNTYFPLITAPPFPTENNPIEWDGLMTFKTASWLGRPQGQCDEPMSVSMQVLDTITTNPAIPDKFTEAIWPIIEDNNVDVEVTLANGSFHRIKIDFRRMNLTSTGYKFRAKPPIGTEDLIDVTSGASLRWPPVGPLLSCAVYKYRKPVEEMIFLNTFSDIRFVASGVTDDSIITNGGSYSIVRGETVNDPLIKLERIYTDADLAALQGIGIKTKGLHNWTLEFDVNIINQKQEATITTVAK